MHGHMNVKFVTKEGTIILVCVRVIRKMWDQKFAFLMQIEVIISLNFLSFLQKYRYYLNH